MKFSKETYNYLINKNFSSSHKLSFINNQNDFTRKDILCNLVKNHKIIDLGCADHLNLIDYKINKNEWLHQLLCNSSRQCVGIDNNRNAIEYLINKYSFKNLYHGNINEMDLNFIYKEQWDELVLGEIIEHVNNPCDFLTSIHNRLKSNINSIIITAPNAWNYNILKLVLKNTENINSDHKYWFSPYTLAKVLTESGFFVTDIYFAYNSMPKHNFILKYIKKKYFMLSESIVIKADFNKNSRI